MYKPWQRGPTHWPDTHFILHILDDPSAVDDDDDNADVVALPEGDGRRAGNFTSESVENTGDIPDRGTTLVPFSVRPGGVHPPTEKRQTRNKTDELRLC